MNGRSCMDSMCGRAAAILFLIAMTPGILTARQSPVDGRLSPDAVGIEIRNPERAYRTGTLLEGAATVPAWWTDGYSLRLAGDGLSGPLGEPPVVIVDGLVMPFAVLGRMHLDALPVSTIDIRAASWSSGIQLSPGSRASAGALRIRTVVPEGTAFRGSVILINDTGDPGPDRYRSGGRNVDRSGPRASVRASINEGPWFFEGSLDADEHHMTDERIADRIRQVFDEPVPPVIRIFHPHGRLRYASDALLVDVRAGRMTSDDFMFMDDLAREWTNRQTWTYVTGRAERRLDEDWSAGLNVAARSFEIDSRDMPFDGPRPLSHRLASVQASLARSWPAGSTSLFAGVDSEDAEQTARFDRVVETRGFAGLGYEIPLSRSTFFSVRARLSHPVDEGLDPRTASSTAVVRVRGGLAGVAWATGVSASSEKRAPLSSMAELYTAGFHLGRLGSPIEPAGLRTRERVTDAFVRLSRRGSGQSSGRPAVGRTVRGVVPWLDVRIRRHQGLTVPDITFALLPDGIRSTSQATYVSGSNGATWQAAAGFDWRPGRTHAAGDERTPGASTGGGAFTLTAHALVRGVLSGSETFRSWVSGLPAYETRLDLGYSKNGRFGADVSALVEGPSEWKMYAVTPFGRRPARTRVDASLWKRIAGDSTLLTLGVRNLLDSPWRVHPAGIDEQLSVRAGMTIRFDTRAGRP